MDSMEAFKSPLDCEDCCFGSSAKTRVANARMVPRIRVLFMILSSSNLSLQRLSNPLGRQKLLSILHPELSRRGWVTIRQIQEIRYDDPTQDDDFDHPCSVCPAFYKRVGARRKCLWQRSRAERSPAGRSTE